MNQQVKSGIGYVADEPQKNDSDLGVIESILRDTKFATTDLKHVIGELEGKINPVLTPDLRVETSDTMEKPLSALSSNSVVHDQIKDIYRMVYELQTQVRLIIERVEL